MSLPRALVTAPVGAAGLRRLQAVCDVVYDPWIETRPLRVYDGAGLARRAAEESARVLVVESDFVTAAAFELPLLAVAATRGDPNNVDLAAATAAGVPVVHTPGRNADAVAELTVGLLLVLARHVVAADADARSEQVWRDGTVPYQRFRGREIAGRRAGLVGLGAVGRAVRWRLEALGMEVLAHDPYVPDAPASLEDVLRGCDVVSMHAAVSAETLGLMDAERFAMLRPGALYLNTARAALHDLEALVAALRGGRLGGAALDHVDGEQLPGDHPLLGLANVVVTPHIGGATVETEERGGAMVAADLEVLLAGGRPRHLANPEVMPG